MSFRELCVGIELVRVAARWRRDSYSTAGIVLFTHCSYSARFRSAALSRDIHIDIIANKTVCPSLKNWPVRVGRAHRRFRTNL